METRIFTTAVTDPHINLAVEEYLLDAAAGQCTLFLWQNANTVVIGANQNAWKECRTRQLEDEGGKLARRITGGGAVYHDLGNLNFSFILPAECYDLHRQLEVILRAVKALGADGEFSGRNDLTAGGRKFSGNAFCHRKHASLHHGTLLVNVDMDKLTQYLNVSQVKIQSKGIDSVRSRVVNLSELAPITIDSMRGALIKSFNAEYGDAPVKSADDLQLLPEVQKLIDKQRSWQWRYGNTLDFDAVLENRFSWGCVELCLALKNGIVTQAAVYSDAMDEEYIASLSPCLTGVAFDTKAMAQALSGVSQEPQHAELLLWLDSVKL